MAAQTIRSCQHEKGITSFTLPWGYWPSKLLVLSLLLVSQLTRAAVSKQWVFICFTLTPFILFILTWESRRVTNIPTIACRNGLSEMSAGIIQLLSQRSFNVYPHCLSTKLCQEKQVPFLNLCLAKQEMRAAKGKRHSFFSDPAPVGTILAFVFRNETTSDSFEPRRVLDKDCCV